MRNCPNNRGHSICYSSLLLAFTQDRISKNQALAAMPILSPRKMSPADGKTSKRSRSKLMSKAQAVFIARYGRRGGDAFIGSEMKQ
jgi:hypothetical protein